MFSAIDFLKFLTIPLLGLVFVNGGVVSYEGCPPFCKEKSLHPVGLFHQFYGFTITLKINITCWFLFLFWYDTESIIFS